MAAFSSNGSVLRDISFAEAKKSLDIADISTIRANALTGTKAVAQYTVVSGQYSAMMADDRKLFLAEDCNALYSANKRFTVTLTNNGNKIDNNCNELFDGSIESVVALSAGTNVILIDFGDNFE